ncbi:helix-turn-helix domain-containing protein [Halomarina salina]|uniref:Helix-turn-helix domain-containing protein n=1 Tax=Halomarina salina TaxID=1872699 RepID=A0ABD5RLC2_9EURY|nr:helix-turn-helix domain-containing protein [Halomarina salina]
MTIIAEFTLGADEFILGQVLSRDPNTHVEIERVVPASRRVMPYIWVHGGDLEEFEETIRASEHVKELAALDYVDESALYRVEWEEEVESLIHGMAQTDASILEARGNEEWYFRIRFDSHTGLTAFHNYCVDHDIRYRLEKVYSLVEGEAEGHLFDLTPPQREAILLALEEGYFEIPRQVTLAELATELDISEQALSERVRRANNKVLANALLSQSVADLQ